MNRVVIGVLSLFVIVGIVILAGRAVKSLNLSSLFRRPVPQTGRLVLPSGAASGFPLASVSPLSTTAPQVVSASPRPSATPSLAVSPRPSPAASSSPSKGGTLPATGF